MPTGLCLRSKQGLGGSVAHPSLERYSALWHQVSPQPDADTQAAPPASSGFPDVSGFYGFRPISSVSA